MEKYLSKLQFNYCLDVFIWNWMLFWLKAKKDCKVWKQWKPSKRFFENNTRCKSWNSPLDFWNNSQPKMRLQTRVIRQWNGNFVGFLEVFMKILKTYSMTHNSHSSGKWQNWPTRTGHLILNFEAVWGQNGLQRLILVDCHTNIVLQWYSFTSSYLEASLL